MMPEMPVFSNLGTNSLSTTEWLSVSKGFYISGSQSDDLMSSFTADVRPILNQRSASPQDSEEQRASDFLPHQASSKAD
jgi:hypothetical protein